MFFYFVANKLSPSPYTALPHNMEIVLRPQITVTSIHPMCMITKRYTA